MFKNLARALLCAPFAFVAPMTPAQDKPPLKIGFVYVSPVGDAGWSYQHDQGRLAMEKAADCRGCLARL